MSSLLNSPHEASLNRVYADQWSPYLWRCSLVLEAESINSLELEVVNVAEDVVGTAALVETLSNVIVVTKVTVRVVVSIKMLISGHTSA